MHLGGKHWGSDTLFLGEDKPTTLVEHGEDATDRGLGAMYFDKVHRETRRCEQAGGIADPLDHRDNQSAATTDDIAMTRHIEYVEAHTAHVLFRTVYSNALCCFT